MSFYLTRTPTFFDQLFSNYRWRFKTIKKEIYLTFDDGPIPEVTEFVLDELKKVNAKATFFCIGENVEKNSTIFNRIITEKHAVGNHTYNHLNGWKTQTKNYLTNVSKAERTFQLYNFPTFQPKLFRPPYGKIKRSQAKAIQRKGYKIIMWDVLSADFDATISKEQCLQNVLKNTKNGSIIVFHDSIKARKNLVFTLPKVLRYFSEKGYVFKAIE